MQTEFITIPIEIIGELPRGEPFKDREAYIDLIFMADENGEFYSTIRKLMDRWKWSNTRVVLFIKQLEEKDILKTQKRHKKDSLYRINTELLSVVKDAKKTQKRHKEDTEVGGISIRAYYPNDEKLNRAFTDFAKMREQTNVPMSDEDTRIVMKKLQKLASDNQYGRMDNDKAIEILEQSTVNHWKSVYPLKKESKRERNLIEEWGNA